MRPLCAHPATSGRIFLKQRLQRPLRTISERFVNRRLIINASKYDVMTEPGPASIDNRQANQMNGLFSNRNRRRCKLLCNQLFAIGVTAVFAGCAVNPVTGKSEFSLVSESEELKMGREAYDPLRQSSGGDYVADRALVAYVDSVGQKLARVSDRDLPYEFRVVNNREVNAWALPGGKIAINRGLLLELENEAELAAVLGHEIVHAAARHSASSISKSTAIGLISSAVVYQAGKDYDADKAVMIGAAANIVGNMVNLKYGRDAERESDHYGMIYMDRAGYDPTAAVTLQEKFFRLKNSQRTPWFEALFASHPPSEERVRNNRRLALKLGAAGDLGTERYQQAVARLVTARPAYEAFEKGRKAYAASRFDDAESQARKAIAIEPNENLFHLLLGDVLTSKGRHDSALAAYDRAAAINPAHYATYENRALLKKAMDDKDGYRADMRKAADIHPTSISFLALGQLAEEDGNPKLALRYFGDAASSKSLSGQTASKAFSRLDPLYNPHKYLRARIARNAEKMLTLTLTNPLETPISEVRVRIEYGNPFVPTTAGRFVLSETVKPGETITRSLPIGPISDSRFKKRQYRAVLDGARADF